jgi:hypothetical protein
MRIDYRHLWFVVALPLGCNSAANSFQADSAQISDGAISWALKTVAKQGGEYLNASYGRLVSPRSQDSVAVPRATPVQTPVPLQIRDGQVFVHYTLTIIKTVGETALGEVLSVHSSYGTFSGGKEYWALQQTGLDDIDDAVAIEIEGVEGDWEDPPSWPPSGSLPVFTNDVAVTWSSGAPGGGDTVFKYGAGSNYFAWVWGLTYSNGWSGQLTWYRTATSTPSSSDLLLGSGTYTLSTQTGGGSPPGGQNWYRASCSPQ